MRSDGFVQKAVAGSVDELLAGASAREPFSAADSKSGARFERVVIDGEDYVVKHLHVDDDWIMRSTGDLGCRPVTVWRAGILDRLPACIDHAIVGVAAGCGRGGWGGALLMRDVSARLVPAGDQPVAAAQHARFLEHMAALHATFWGFEDGLGLTPPLHRYLEFSPVTAALETGRGCTEAVPALIVEGWRRFEGLAGPVGLPVLEVVDDPTVLVEALDACPQTLLQGDWKMGNLGSLADGRTVLLDWAVPGQGCATSELTWYLALNSARLPESKEDAIERFRQDLESEGVSTRAWWDRALDLALLGGLVWFGWEKALGKEEELRWWLERAQAGLTRL